MEKDQKPMTNTKNRNVGKIDRWISAIGAGALFWGGSGKRIPSNPLMILGGTYLLYRTLSGKCWIYRLLGISTSRASEKFREAGQEIRVEKSITLNKSPEEVYRFWRNFENLPMFMDHLESVRNLDDRRSHWVAKAPAGMSVEWDAEIIEDRENEMITWQSLENADVKNRGTVRFERSPDGGSTELRVSLTYEPPAGKTGKIIARLFGEEPDQQIEDDLRAFKRQMETGEVPVTAGQPFGGN